MYIDQINSNQEIHYTILPNNQKSDEVHLTENVSYILKNEPENTSEKKEAQKNELNLELYLYEDISLLIDYISQEIKQLSLPFEGTPNVSSDDEIRNIVSKALADIRCIAELNLYDSRNVQDIEAILHMLSFGYLERNRLAEHHVFNSILSKNIEKVPPNERFIVVEHLNKLGNLHQSIINFKPCFINLLNSLEDTYSLELFNDTDFIKMKHIIEVAEKILQMIEKKRQAHALHFFNWEKDKTKAEFLMQTIDALHLNELNKLEKLLTRMKEKLRFFGFHDSIPMEKESRFPSLKNKKVVIFTCSFGTGHKVTAGAIKHTLQQAQAKVSIHDLSLGALLGQDSYRFIFKKLQVNYENHPLNSVDLFNEILKRQLYFVVNALDETDFFVRQSLYLSGKNGVASAVGVLNNSWAKTQIRNLLLFERPDHIITAYHMDLNPILEVAEELGIPVLHVPTDYNMKFWEVFGEQPPTYPHFKSLIPNTGIDRTYKTKAPLFSEHVVEGVGIPLREEFYSSLTQEEALSYRQRRGIKEEEKVIFLSAGGNGQNLPHPELLANSTTWKNPTRIEIIAGKNREFVQSLQQTLKPVNGNPLLLHGTNPYVTVEVVANPDKSKIGTEEEYFIPAKELSKILDITDVSIAKAGGLSVSELLFKGVPILFDHRKTPFTWELFNIEVTVEENMGNSNFYLSDLENDLQNILQSPTGNKEHFHFEKSREILCETIKDQIHQAEQDVEIADRRGDLLFPLEF